MFSSRHPTLPRLLRLPQAATTRRHLFQALPKSDSAFVVAHCCRKVSYCFRLLGAQSRSRANICSAEICLAVVERICRSPSCQFCSTGQYEAFRMAATYDDSSLGTSASAQACTHVDSNVYSAGNAISFYIHTYFALFVTIACDPRAACGTLVPAPNLLPQGLVPCLSVPRAVFSESATVAKSTTSRTRALIAAEFCTASPPQSSCFNHKLKWNITDEVFVNSCSL